MPIYEYSCEACGYESELFCKYQDKPDFISEPHGDCSGHLLKSVLSPLAFYLHEAKGTSSSGYLGTGRGPRGPK